MRQKKRILLINPPSPPGTTANREGAGGLGALYPSPGGFFYPAHTLASTASVLRQLGYGVMVLDMVAWQGNASIAVKVLETGTWHAVMVFVSHVTLQHDLNFVRFLRQKKDSPPIVVIGPVTRFLKPRSSRVPADVIILGEPERVLPEAHESIFSVAAGEEAFFVSSGGNGLVDDLDSLPFPAWELVPKGKNGFLTVYGSKGCSRRCAYCPYVGAQGGKVRTRSIEAVIQELQWIVKDLSTNWIMFRDIAFASDSSRVEALCRGLIDNRLNIRWECESHPLDFQPSLLKLMRRAGCVEIKIGLETADPDCLQEWNRVGSNKEAEEYLAHIASLQEACRRIGIRCHIFLMLGVPGENEESVQTTVNYLRKLRAQLINVKQFQPYPGVALTGMSLDALDPGQTSALFQLLQSCRASAEPRRKVGLLPVLGRLFEGVN